MKFLRNSIPVFVLAFYTGSLVAQDPSPTGMIPELFKSEKIFEFTIRTNLPSLINHSGKEETYQPAVIILEGENGNDTLPLRIRVRGNFRKDTNNCDFPPLRLNFKKEDVRNTVFGPQDEFRVVTHCQTDDAGFIRYVYREYYVYKLYQAISPFNLNVRLARINYEDNSGKMKTLTRDAFILEDEDEFATRLNMEQVSDKLVFEQISEQNGLMLSMFQFMIGNTDWIVPFAKNLVFLRKGDGIYAVPYDFDYCGIVNADYKNEEGYTKLSYPERIFKGKCYSDDQLKTAFKYFRKSRKKFMKVLFSAGMLDHESFIYMYNYIMQFYTIIHSKQDKLKYFYVNCGIDSTGIMKDLEAYPENKLR
ncbi:MAG TPA: hypothetical protein VI583_18740 [Cyclobacteriaceae bacterium]|nr:hypothetical protein [Cyclobacteriaceae bacterium]